MAPKMHDFSSYFIYIRRFATPAKAVAPFQFFENVPGLRVMQARTGRKYEG